MAEYCKHVRPDGSQCKAFAAYDSGLCVAHDPQKAAMMKEARRKGALASHLRVKGSLNIPEPKTPAEVVDALAKVFAAAASGRIPTKVATALAYVCDKLLRGHEIANLQRRVEALERNK